MDKAAFNQQFNAAASVLQDLITQQHALVCGEMDQLKESKLTCERDIDAQRQELNNEREAFEEMKKKLETLYPINDEVVDLNVGGKKFSTVCPFFSDFKEKKYFSES
jgi:hypothetical protein